MNWYQALNGDLRFATRRAAEKHDAYLHGLDSPLYPVPAIPIDVEWYPDPLIVMQSTVAVEPDMMAEGRCWVTVWRSDGRTDWF